MFSVYGFIFIEHQQHQQHQKKLGKFKSQEKISQTETAVSLLSTKNFSNYNLKALFFYAVNLCSHPQIQHRFEFL